MKIVQALRVHEAHTTAPDKMQVLPVAFKRLERYERLVALDTADLHRGK